MGLFDIFKKNSDPISKNEKMRKIRQSGRDGEDQFRRDKFLSNIERKHHGRDFDEHVSDWDGKTRKIPWEVKRNDSPLSPKQKKTRNLHVRRYVDTPYGVEAQTEDKHGNKLEHNMLSGKWEKVKKQKDSGFSLFSSDSKTKKKRSSKKKSSNQSLSDLIFGSSKPRPRKKKAKSSKPSLSDVVYGSSKPKKSRKKKAKGRSDVDKLWGSKSGSDSIW